MQEFYFTFGSNHWTSEGFPMKNSWVRVTAVDYETAREIFVKEFTSIKMRTPMSFAFQYTEEDFEKEWFPLGEYLHLSQ